MEITCETYLNVRAVKLRGNKRMSEKNVIERI